MQSILDPSPPPVKPGSGSVRPQVPPEPSEPSDPPWIVRKVIPVLMDRRGRPISPQLARLQEILETCYRDNSNAWPGTDWLARRYGCKHRNMQLLIAQAVEAGLTHRVIEGKGRKSRVGFLALKRFDPYRPMVADNPEAIALAVAKLKADRSGKAQSPAPSPRPASPRKAQSATYQKAQSPAPEVRRSSNEDKNVNVGATSTWLRSGGEESGTPEPTVVQAGPVPTPATPIEPPTEAVVIAPGDGPPAAVEGPRDLAGELVARFLARGIRVELDPSAGPDKARWVPEPGANPIRPEEKAELVKFKPQILAFLKAQDDPDPSPQAEPIASSIEDKIRRLRFGVPEAASELTREVAKLFAERWKDPGSIGGFRKNLGRVATGEIPVKAAINAYRKASKCGPDANPGAIWNYWLNQARGCPS